MLSKFTIILLLLTNISLYASQLSTIKSKIRREEKPTTANMNLVFPYIFRTDSMGVTVGAGGVFKGQFQDQLMLGATAFASSEGARGIYLGGWDYLIPGTKRFFLSIDLMYAYYPSQRTYGAIDYFDRESHSGDNDSDKNDFKSASGHDNWFDIKLEYVLPIGAAEKSPIIVYDLKGGILSSETDSGLEWNPLTSGITTLFLKQTNRYRDYEIEPEVVETAIHPLQLGISYNNTNFPVNPAYGSIQNVAYTEDFGWFESNYEWNFIEFEYKKFYSFGASQHSKQRTIAFDFWTADTPSWETEINSKGESVIVNRPPAFEGATLGGFYRMKAYPANRFNDRSVIYTSLEYRYTLKWNPIAEVKWLHFLQSDWIQIVPFAEGGRVAPEYRIETLTEDWKFDVGVGFRALFDGGVLRFDIAVGDEGVGFWAMMGQPF
ncbi:MAG: BamA/TamA family outer membrane protein [Lentisphaeria bacterium]|nr:BamA/TamA family outer membrane protein [Lentisphaeria bacterium]